MSIIRSRRVVEHDRHFQPANWQPLLNFLRATGLRRQEVRDLKVRDLTQDADGRAYVHVQSGKGGRMREVPVLPGHEEAVLQQGIGKDLSASVFERIPKHLDVHSYRREYAQALYLLLAPGRNLPPASGRLCPQDYDRAAAKQVTQALGHNRLDVLLTHYLR
jgi:hypothetical protein